VYLRSADHYSLAELPLDGPEVRVRDKSTAAPNTLARCSRSHRVLQYNKSKTLASSVAACLTRHASAKLRRQHVHVSVLIWQEAYFLALCDRSTVRLFGHVFWWLDTRCSSAAASSLNTCRRFRYSWHSFHSLFTGGTQEDSAPRSKR
jgi:hypothetical protein